MENRYRAEISVNGNGFDLFISITHNHQIGLHNRKWRII